MLMNLTAHVTVYVIGVVAAATVVTQDILRDCWANRWRGRFRGEPTDKTSAEWQPTDIHAVVAELRVAYTYRRVVAVVLAAGAVTWVLWWSIYVLVVVVT
jgi:hypothetical protein